MKTAMRRITITATSGGTIVENENHFQLICFRLNCSATYPGVNELAMLRNAVEIPLLARASTYLTQPPTQRFEFAARRFADINSQFAQRLSISIVANR